MKIVAVETCYDCPYHQCGAHAYNDNGDITWDTSPLCTKRRKVVRKTIPEWCPLEEGYREFDLDDESC